MYLYFVLIIDIKCIIQLKNIGVYDCLIFFLLKLINDNLHRSKQEYVIYKLYTYLLCSCFDLCKLLCSSHFNLSKKKKLNNRMVSLFLAHFFF